MLVFYLDRFAEDERFAAFAVLADQYVFSLRISAGSLRRSTVENHFSDRHVFADLLQCASSSQAVALIEKMSDKQAEVLRGMDVAKVRDSAVIRRYIDACKSHYPAEKRAHKDDRSSLAGVLHNEFFQG
jgi:hypothetical protein